MLEEEIPRGGVLGCRDNPSSQKPNATSRSLLAKKGKHSGFDRPSDHSTTEQKRLDVQSFRIETSHHESNNAIIAIAVTHIHSGQQPVRIGRAFREIRVLQASRG